MHSQTGSRAAAIAALVLVLSGGLAAGCGGDDGGGPADSFIGRWYQVSPTANTSATGFTISLSSTCVRAMLPPPIQSGS